MSDFPEDLQIKLGAFVDGELTPSEQTEVEQLIESDPAVAAEVEALFALNNDVSLAFDALLSEPVPDHIGLPPAAPAPPANDNRAPVFSMVASLLVGAVLGAGLFWAAERPGTAPEPVQVAAARSWLGEVAEYHQIYARQTKHLVEVPAAQKDHLESWLGKETGLAFKVPDLTASGWTFEGGRLLVAAGKPVAQLLYTNAEGQVIALCALRNGSGTAQPITPRSFGDVHMATWKSQSGSFAIVGDQAADLPQLAEQAAPLV